MLSGNECPSNAGDGKNITDTTAKHSAAECETYENTYIARQPIFDRDMGIHGYELLYRQGSDNFFVQMDDNQATTELIYNSFFVFGLYDLTEGTKAFINFSKELIETDIPTMLPKQSIIVEILERNPATQATVEACKRIKAMGYSLALDDFIFDEYNQPLLELVDIVKIDYPSLSLDVQSKLIKKYGKQTKFLAEKLETREDFNIAMKLGYDYFQGYFFCKPSMFNSRDVASLNINLFNILKELNTLDPCFSHVAEIIEGDLGLSLKLLKLANSVYFAARSEITSILHALSFIGLNELYQWISIMMLKEQTNIENAAVVKLSLVRAKFMELLAKELHPKDNPNEYFFTGMFSFIDVLLNQSMEKVLKGLPLSDKVKQALLGEENEQCKLLNCVIDYETANMDESEEKSIIGVIGSKKFMSIYIDAIKWVNSLNY
jgi:c-di-GMP-related signal transduction protein